MSLKPGPKLIEGMFQVIFYPIKSLLTQSDYNVLILFSLKPCGLWASCRAYVPLNWIWSGNANFKRQPAAVLLSVARDSFRGQALDGC